MKTLILLSCLVLAGLPVWADDAANTNGPAANIPSTDERTAAMDINKALRDMAHGGDSSDAAWDAMDARIGGYQKKFGTTPQTTNNLVLLRKVQLAVAKKLGEARYDALVQKLAADPVPEVAALVAKVAALKTKPMDLQFTAVDGTAVDLAKLRGKVVLIDFWATWCGPCVEEVPDVVATYQKFHDKGFEVVGISLDKDKAAVLTFTKEHGMVWPQYFDGKGWDNDISKGYGINSIPAMWLVDQKGMLVTMTARDDLAGQVEKLLAAP
jgi:thiol-disulfide isomerase/thioredoxin